MDELSEVTRIGSIAVTAGGTVEIRQDTLIVRGDEIVAGPKYHRYMLMPGDDLSGEDDQVVAVAQAAWTDAVVAAYQASLEMAPQAESLP